MDLVLIGTLGPDRRPALIGMNTDTRAWLEEIGFAVAEEAPWLEALTHGSYNGSSGKGRPEAPDYQRLEFLGDRVLGLSVASWLFDHGTAPEGRLSQRLNALVSGETCARIARALGLPEHIRLGKQAREDGGAHSDHILGDIMESLIGASFVEHGYEKTRDVVLQLWANELTGDVGKAKHPKSALQEWAAGNQRAMPEYEIVERSGPDHAMRFTVQVSIHKVGTAKATASSKGEAEKRAAKAFLEEYG